MAVPSTAADLSTTAASNSPAGSDSIGTSLDDYLRALGAIIKQENSKGADIASASTIDVPAAGSYFVVTGTTGIGTISDDWTGRTVFLKFSDALILTHSSGLLLPGAANVTTVAGDVFGFNNESTGVWRCVFYQPVGGYQPKDADLTALAGLTSAANKVPMFSGSGTATLLDFKDEDNMASDSATAVPSQQSVKAYVDASAGVVVQVVEATPIATVVTCNTALPRDDSIPQSGEGNEVITVAITPTSATNRLRIEFECCGTPSTASYDSCALFQDATAGALTGRSVYSGSSGLVQLHLTYEMEAGTASATTFKIRCGADTGTFYVNAGTTTGTRLFGGVATVRLRVTEIAV